MGRVFNNILTGLLTLILCGNFSLMMWGIESWLFVDPTSLLLLIIHRFSHMMIKLRVINDKSHVVIEFL